MTGNRIISAVQRHQGNAGQVGALPVALNHRTRAAGKWHSQSFSRGLRVRANTDASTELTVQKAAFESNYRRDEARWAFHYTKDPLTRFLRDRRLGTALKILHDQGQTNLEGRRILVVCAGVGGEGTFFRRAGFSQVTVSDFSAEALDRCRTLDPALSTLQLDAEGIDLPDNSYDIVVVQDGLHHLPRPVLGFTEMLRVARDAVVLIEPHTGLVGRIVGRTWEVQGQAINYVFRWNRLLVEQAVRSYLLSRDATVIAHRMWDHGSLVARVVDVLPPRLRLKAAKALYSALGPFSGIGNMMVAVVVLGHESTPERLQGH